MCRHIVASGPGDRREHELISFHSEITKQGKNTHIYNKVTTTDGRIGLNKHRSKNGTRKVTHEEEARGNTTGKVTSEMLGQGQHSIDPYFPAIKREENCSYNKLQTLSSTL